MGFILTSRNCLPYERKNADARAVAKRDALKLFFIHHAQRAII
jgi:hypothetical protein